MSNINIDNLDNASSDILKDYGDVVFTATEKGLNSGQKILINNLKSSSPKLSGQYKKSWKGKSKRYKLKRYVGNTKLVKGKSGDIPLSNILEYGSDSEHKGLIKKTYNQSINGIAQAMIAEIKKEV